MSDLFHRGAIEGIELLLSNSSDENNGKDSISSLIVYSNEKDIKTKFKKFILNYSLYNKCYIIIRMSVSYVYLSSGRCWIL